MVSPNDMLAAATQEMLGGKKPETREDWAQIINFVAYNIDSEVAHLCCHVFGSIYDCPLTEKEIAAIVDFQVKNKQKHN